MTRLAAIILTLLALTGAPQSAMAAALRPEKTASEIFSSSPTLHAPRDTPQTLDLAGRNEAHDYETASGRPKWPSRDPIGEQGGVNLMGFVLNSGINGLDYLGNATIAGVDFDYTPKNDAPNENAPVDFFPKFRYRAKYRCYDPCEYQATGEDTEKCIDECGIVNADDLYKALSNKQGCYMKCLAKIAENYCKQIFADIDIEKIQQIIGLGGAARGRGGAGGQGERNRAARPDGTPNPFKHMKQHPTKPDKVIYKDANGQKKEMSKPPGFPE